MIELAAVAGATIGAYFGARRAVSSKLAQPYVKLYPPEGVGPSSTTPSGGSSRRRTRSTLAQPPEDNVRVYGL